MSPTQDALAAQTLCIWHHGQLKRKGQQCQTKASLNHIKRQAGRGPGDDATKLPTSITTSTRTSQSV